MSKAEFMCEIKIKTTAEIVNDCKDCKAKLNDIHAVVEATKFAINRYGESKYPKYEALNSLACAASVQCMTDMRENYKAGRISDAEWIKYGKGL